MLAVITAADQNLSASKMVYLTVLGFDSAGLGLLATSSKKSLRLCDSARGFEFKKNSRRAAETQRGDVASGFADFQITDNRQQPEGHRLVSSGFGAQRVHSY